METLKFLAPIIAVVEFGLTIWILVTARSAKSKAEEAANAVKESAMAFNVSTCRKIAEEISDLIAKARYDGALLRVRDLITMFSELKYSEIFINEELKHKLNEDITELIAMEVNLKEFTNDEKKEPNFKRIRRVLSRIEADCADWGGRAKYRISKGDFNGR